MSASKVTGNAPLKTMTWRIKIPLNDTDQGDFAEYRAGRSGYAIRRGSDVVVADVVL